MNKNKIQKIFSILEQYYTRNEIIELKYTNNYTLLISVLLSAQATDKGVNKATEELFKIADTPEKILALGEVKLKQYLKTLNYYNTKTKHILELSKILVEKFNSQIPTTREELESLPGIGRKTANVVLNIVFDKIYPNRKSMDESVLSDVTKNFLNESASIKKGKKSKKDEQ